MSAPSGGSLQFDRMEGGGARAAPKCVACNRGITTSYYEANGKVVCESCKGSAESELAGGSRIARIVRALVLGTLAAAVCSVAWFAIVKLTGYQIGLVAIVVGLVVGGAVRMGSRNRGGWPYQILAVLLTYLSIGLSNVPLVMDAARKGFGDETAAEQDAPGDPGAEHAAAAETVDPAAREFGLLVASIALSLAMPVLQVTEGGVIGLLIVCFALYEAWKINKRQKLVFNGPFLVDSAARASGA